ncbi:MAG: hypothetical protein H6752_21630 [Candidatus Omnitrophica bacterium]|nr:hypothetical protein [Candidatus Omnitrophota bacterium]
MKTNIHHKYSIHFLTLLIGYGWAASCPAQEFAIFEGIHEGTYRSWDLQDDVPTPGPTREVLVFISQEENLLTFNWDRRFEGAAVASGNCFSGMDLRNSSDRVVFEFFDACLVDNEIIGTLFSPGDTRIDFVLTCNGGCMPVDDATASTIIRWNTGDGDFGVAENWEPQQVPSDTDLALFDRETPVTISITSETALSRRANIDRGAVTFAGGIYDLSSLDMTPGRRSFEVGTSSSDIVQCILTMGHGMESIHSAIGRDANANGVMTVAGEGVGWTNCNRPVDPTSPTSAF